MTQDALEHLSIERIVEITVFNFNDPDIRIAVNGTADIGIHLVLLDFFTVKQSHPSHDTVQIALLLQQQTAMFDPVKLQQNRP